MKLYLIRHGETVDNLKGLYAGVRDSALTIHGHEQARRLGEHLAKSVKLTHVFASPLTRAFKTAESIQQAQAEYGVNGNISVVKASALIEQDFGYYEGKSFLARSDPKKIDKDAHHEQHKNDPSFVDMESKASMAARADTFLDEHLLPLMDLDGELAVAVVSHGMLLSSLWKCLLLRLSRKTLAVAPEVTTMSGPIVLEHLGGWSNTGYLELALLKDTVVARESTLKDEAAPATSIRESTATMSADAAPKTSHIPTRHILHGWSTTIVAINSKRHLTGLRRQRGGIGSLAHDEGQKKLDDFFTRQRKG